MMTARDQLVNQIDAALVHYMNLQANQSTGVKVVNGIQIAEPVLWAEAGAFCSSAVSAIENATGRDSSRANQARRCADDFYNMPAVGNPVSGRFLAQLKGIVDDLRSALMAGHLVAYGELIRSEVFGDVLDMASHLLDEGYKDPAAVIAGTALEIHMRELCKKASIPISVTKGTDVVPKRAASMNDDLRKQGIYSSLEQKQVAFWQDLRNKAAHGDYGLYDHAQVAQMVQGVRDFIAKYPA